MRVAVAQNNFIAGDLDYNFNKIVESYNQALEDNCDLVVFSELSICGYPVDDLLFKEYFHDSIDRFMKKIIDLTKYVDCYILIGLPIKKDSLLYNGAALIGKGEFKKQFLKNSLPNYKLFDEKRYFKNHNEIDFFELNGSRLSVMICEDCWDLYNLDKVKSHKSDAVIVLNASPFSPDKDIQRYDVCSKYALGLSTPLIYVNQVGGVDSFLFDGNSFVMNERGHVNEKCSSFAEDFLSIELSDLRGGKELSIDRDLDRDLYEAAVLSLRDYVFKTGFKKVLIGMSGGIDSALVAVMAVDALGPENVRLVALPTRFNSSQSFQDAKECAENLSVELKNISIQNIVDSVLLGLRPEFKDYESDATEENIQSRIRGVMLMAMSNKFNELLITTGNKSEMATGYATIYGDMNGAFNPIKDLYKTQVFKIANWRNKNIPKISIYNKDKIIPKNIIEKAPSAELSFDQKDSDSLPDYEVLDKILFNLIEGQKSVTQIVKEYKFEKSLVEKIVKLFYQNEYKRKQSAIGPKLSKMSFDRDRRYLITSKFWH